MLVREREAAKKGAGADVVVHTAPAPLLQLDLSTIMRPHPSAVQSPPAAGAAGGGEQLTPGAPQSAGAPGPLAVGRLAAPQEGDEGIGRGCGGELELQPLSSAVAAAGTSTDGRRGIKRAVPSTTTSATAALASLNVGVGGGGRAFLDDPAPSDGIGESVWRAGGSASSAPRGLLRMRGAATAVISGGRISCHGALPAAIAHYRGSAVAGPSSVAIAAAPAVLAEEPAAAVAAAAAAGAAADRRAAAAAAASRRPSGSVETRQLLLAAARADVEQQAGRQIGLRASLGRFPVGRSLAGASLHPQAGQLSVVVGGAAAAGALPGGGIAPSLESGPASHTVAMPPLPPGWRAAQHDRGDGSAPRTYFYHAATGTSSWRMPTATSSP
jgi:hypothetical protein